MKKKRRGKYILGEKVFNKHTLDYGFIWALNYKERKAVINYKNKLFINIEWHDFGDIEYFSRYPTKLERVM